MEHLNRLVKIAIEGLGANKSENAIKRTAKAVGVLSKALESYDAALGIRSTSGKHSKKVMPTRLFNSYYNVEHFKQQQQSIAHLIGLRET